MRKQPTDIEFPSLGCGFSDRPPWSLAQLAYKHPYPVDTSAARHASTTRLTGVSVGRTYPCCGDFVWNDPCVDVSILWNCHFVASFAETYFETARMGNYCVGKPMRRQVPFCVWSSLFVWRALVDLSLWAFFLCLLHLSIEDMLFGWSVGSFWFSYYFFVVALPSLLLHPMGPRNMGMEERLSCGMPLRWLTACSGANRYCEPLRCLQETFVWRKAGSHFFNFRGDRKRWMGGRSRTLAPPRGAAWIVDCLLLLIMRGVGDELDAWDA